MWLQAGTCPCPDGYIHVRRFLLSRTRLAAFFCKWAPRFTALFLPESHLRDIQPCSCREAPQGVAHFIAVGGSHFWPVAIPPDLTANTRLDRVCMCLQWGAGNKLLAGDYLDITRIGPLKLPKIPLQGEPADPHTHKMAEMSIFIPEHRSVPMT